MDSISLLQRYEKAGSIKSEIRIKKDNLQFTLINTNFTEVKPKFKIMKRILFVFFLFFQLAVFSQSEIWGVKQYYGALGGGYLYSIDSVANKVNIQHRFANVSTLESSQYQQPKKHNASGSWLGIVDRSLVKVNELSNQVDYKYMENFAWGQFYELYDAEWLVLQDSGLYKINPYSLELKEIDGVFMGNSSNDLGLTRFNDQFLYWNQVANYYDGIICRLDLQTEQVETIYNFDDFKDANYQPVGKLVKIGNLLYGLSYIQNQGERGMFIFSFNPSSGMFNEEFYVGNNNINDSEVVGLTLYNGILYGIGKIIEDEDINYVFSFDPSTKEIDNLAVLDENICSGPNTSLQLADNGKFYAAGRNKGIGNFGSIFSFDIITNSIELVHSFSGSKLALNLRRSFALKNEDVYFFDKSEDSNYSFLFERKNLDLHKLDTIFDITNILPSNEGSIPSNIIQAPSGKIIGNTIHGGSFLNSLIGNGLLYEFDPLTKDYKVLKVFTDFGRDVFPSELFSMSDNRIFGIAESSTRSFNDTKYIYDLNNNEYTRLGDFPWNRSIESAEMISDSNLLMIISFKGREPYSLMKYNVFTDDYDTLLSPPDTEFLSNLERYSDSVFLFQKVIEGGSDSDSSIVVSYNMNTGDEEAFLDLNQYKVPGRNKERFYFTVSEDQKLLGTFMNNIFVKDEKGEKYEYWTYNPASYMPESGQMKILFDSSMYYDKDSYLMLIYKVTEAYQDAQNTFFALNESGGESINCGVMKEFSIDENEVQTLEYLEDYLLNSSNTFAQINVEPSKLIRVSGWRSFKYWSGNESKDWYNKNNWLGYNIPDTSDYVVINALVPHHPVIDTFVKCNSINVLEHARLDVNPFGSLTVVEEVINNGSIHLYGNDTLKASFIHSQDFQINNSTTYNYLSDTNIREVISSPLETEGFNFSEYMDVYVYDPHELMWDENENYPFYPEKEQVYFYDQEFKSLIFKGEIHHQDLEIDIPYAEEEIMYPIPNPYAASLDWTQLDLSQLENKALYRFNIEDSTYSAFVDGMGWESPLIQPLDVVWVYSGGNESIALKSADRFHASMKDLEIEKPLNELIISVNREGLKDQAIISFNPLASSEFDGEYDAIKQYLSKSEKPNIFTKTSDKILSINQLPDTSMMDLFVESGNNGNYTISVDKHQGFDFLVLEDLIWNKRIDLLEQDYNFDYFVSDGHYPFKLYFSEWAMQAVADEDVQIYYYPESIYVRSSKQIDDAQILFYDLAGRVVLELQAHDFHYFEKHIDLVGGHYIVQLKTGDLVVNRMIWVQR